MAARLCSIERGSVVAEPVRGFFSLAALIRRAGADFFALYHLRQGASLPANAKVSVPRISRNA